MKKILFVISLLPAITLNAQTFHLGAKGGVNISNYTGGHFDSKALVGFYVGGYLSFNLGKNLALQPEALFSSQGAKIEDAGDKENFKVSYITIPVMVRFITNGGFYLEAGPQVGFKTGENIPGQTVEDFAKGLDLSAGAGLGYQGKRLGFGARYLAGLSKVGDFDASMADPDFRNSVIQVGIMVRIL